MNHRTYTTVVVMITLTAILFRFNQYLDQTLLDDEWHAIHQIVNRPLTEWASTYAVADYSVPLTLLYWAEAQWGGVSELSLRWPMMLAGLATCILFPFVLRTRYDKATILVFAALLATSAVLVIYSRTARPYALTLFLSYAAHWAFHQYQTHTHAKKAFSSGALYVVAATLVGWLHLIALPFAIAPLIVAFIRLWQHERAQWRPRLQQIAVVAVPTALLLAILVLLPLINNYAALGAKTGTNTPTLDTLGAVWFIWLGTSQAWVATVLLIFAFIGIPVLARTEPLFESAAYGVALTLALVVVMQPAWIQHPITFGRYLLPIVPILLLAIAVGANRVATGVQRRVYAHHAVLKRVICIPVLVAPILIICSTSPLVKMLPSPNNNTQHILFQFDFRPSNNPVKSYLQQTPLSPYWQSIAAQHSPTTIAVAPFYFESHDWDAPRWEALSKKRVIPGLLTGLCVTNRAGEAPQTSQFKFRNSVHLNDAAELAKKGISMIAFQKPFHRTGKPVLVGQETAHCEAALRDKFGMPVYDDATLAVFNTNRYAKAIND